MELKSLDLKGLFFIIILFGLSLVMLQLFSPFLDIVIVALVIVQIFYPVYNFIHEKTKMRTLSSIITTLLTYLLVFIPIVVIGFLTVFEIVGIINTLPDIQASRPMETSNPLFEAEVKFETDAETISDLELVINNSLTDLDNKLADQGVDLKELLVGANIVENTQDEFLRVNINSVISQLLNTIKDSIAPLLTGLVSGGATVLFFVFLLTVTLIYMFSEYSNLPEFVSKISPLDDGLDKLLFEKFTETNRAVLIGSFAVAISQATSVSVMLILLGIGAPVLLWMIMLLLSLIPVGSGLVWAPIGAALILTGRPLEGIILIVYSAVIINVVDTYIRPKVMKNKVRLHPLVIIFSALGGISMFGLLGILYGPVIAVFFTSLMDVYADKYSSRTTKK